MKCSGLLLAGLGFLIGSACLSAFSGLRCWLLPSGCSILLGEIPVVPLLLLAILGQGRISVFIFLSPVRRDYL